MQRDKLFKIFELLEVEKQLNESLESFLDMAAQHTGADVGDLKRAVDTGSIMSELVDVHENYFTDEELDAFIAFFSVPPGDGILRKLPDLTERVNQIASSMAEKRLDDFFEARANNPPPDNSGNSGNTGPN